MDEAGSRTDRFYFSDFLESAYYLLRLILDSDSWLLTPAFL
ncbi:MAG: hypothetical protein QOC96_1968 [Acidobacteriota bacterium]|jgi:hypothetical protein|nr:hypothetical protein [Acidobacteriota bacterium]